MAKFIYIQEINIKKTQFQQKLTGTEGLGLEGGTRAAGRPLAQASHLPQLEKELQPPTYGPV